MTNFANGWIATLSAGIDDSDTTVAVSSTDGMPVRPFQVLIEAEGSNADEIITVTDLTSSTITLTRASEPISDGSQVASAHANGATISHVLTAGSLTALVSGGATLNFVIDGGGSAITTGIKGDLLLGVLEAQVGCIHTCSCSFGVLALREAENQGLH